MGSDAAAAGNVIGYDVARITFQFKMPTPDAMTVGCTVSSTAPDFLAAQKGTCPTERKGLSSAA
jgi:hypothetical protein